MSKEVYLIGCYISNERQTELLNRLVAFLVDHLKENAWFLCSFGSILLDYEIIIYCDNKIKNVININDENREELKKFNYATTNN